VMATLETTMTITFVCAGFWQFEVCELASFKLHGQEQNYLCSWHGIVYLYFLGNRVSSLFFPNVKKEKEICLISIRYSIPTVYLRSCRETSVTCLFYFRLH
jgi:hypothetical protein